MTQPPPDTDTSEASPTTETPPPTREASRRPRRGLEALRYRDFRYLTVGTGFAIASYWMILIAQGWLVLELTDSPFWVAAASSALAIPSLIFGPIAGVIADRLYRKTLLIVTRSLISVLGVIEGTLILADLIDVWQILVFAFLTGTAYAMDIPARQSLIPDTVPEDVVPSGVAINVSVFSVAAITGPLAGAATLATVGAGGCFLANAVGNMALVAAIAAIHVPRRERTTDWNVVGDFVSALRFVRATPVVLLVLLIALLGMIATAPWRELAPVFVRDVFDADEAGLGALFTGSGVGAVIGAAILIAIASVERRALIVGIAATLGLLSVLGFAASPGLQVAVGFALLNGLANQLTWAVAQTVLLLRTPEEFRGRIMALWMLLWGVQPIGTLIAGTLAELFTPRSAVISMTLAVGVLMLLVATRMRRTWSDF